MTGFNAGALVAPLDYDFTDFVPGVNGDWRKGTIPEPDDARMAQYMNDLKTVIEEVRGSLPSNIDTGDPAAMIAAISTLETDNFISAQAKMAEIYSRLAGGKLAAEQILEVPPRVRSLFFAWLRKETSDPEVLPAAGTRVVSIHQRAAGG
jgi:hypothetical protein